VIAPTADDPGGDASPHGALFWTGAAVGWAVMVFAVWGILGDPGATNPSQLVRWVVGAALVHDLLIAPVVTAVAVLLARRAPPWWGRPVGWAAAASATIVLFAVPLVRGFGEHVLNASALPRDYTANLIAVVAMIWAATALTVTVRALGRRRAR
jgi:hypothetical protein